MVERKIKKNKEHEVIYDPCVPAMFSQNKIRLRVKKKKKKGGVQLIDVQFFLNRIIK